MFYSRFRSREEEVGSPVSSSGTLSESPRQAPVQRRRVAKVHSHSSLEVVSTFGGVALNKDSLPPVIQEEEEQRLPVLYEVFQLSIEVGCTSKHEYSSFMVIKSS